MIKRKLTISFIKTLIKLAIESCDEIPAELKDIFGDTSDDLLDITDDILDANSKIVCETVDNKIDGIIEQYDVPEDHQDNIKAEICDLIDYAQNDITLELLCDKEKMGTWLLNKYEKLGSCRSEYEEIPQIIRQVGRALCVQFQKSQDFAPQMLLDNRETLARILDGNIKLLEEGKIARENDKEIIALLNTILDKLNAFGETSAVEEEPPIQSDDYKSRWTKNMFLNNFSPGSKYNLSLAKLYGSTDNFLIQYAVWGHKIPLYDGFKKEYISPDELRSLLLDDSKLGNGLIVLGMPGIGKSTLIAWYCNAYTKRKVRAFSLPTIIPKHFSDVNKNEFLKLINLSESDLRNSVLILDGLDEIESISDKGIFANKILYILSNVPGLSIIITCRVNYIDTKILQSSYVILLPWKPEQIDCFINRFKDHIKTENVNQKRIILKNKHEVYGIPLITYMVIATDIKVNAADTETDIYDKLFAIDGGIFDHQIDRNDIDNPRPLDRETKEQILDKSREIAFWMFEHGGKNDIPDVFNKIEGLKENHFYNDYFKMIRHTEGTAHMNFVHRSMYEYFTVDYLIHKLDILFDDIAQSNYDFSKYKIRLATLLAEFCKKGKIKRPELEASLITDFLRAKLKKLFHSKKLIDKYSLRYEVYCFFEESIVYIFEKGCIYFAYKNNSLEQCAHTINEERNCADNLFSMLFMIYRCYNVIQDGRMHKPFEYSQKIYPDQNENISKYIKLIAPDTSISLPYSELTSIKLDHSYLYSADLKLANLQSANFCFAFMRNINLRSANLQFAKISSASLNSADLCFAKLSSAKLRNAELSSALLTSAKMEKADLRSANLEDAILCNAILSNASLCSAKFDSANLENANLEEADLGHSSLCSANLHNVVLNSASLHSADLRFADLTSAKCQSTDFRNANLCSATLRCSDLRNSYLNEVELLSADLSYSDLREADLRDTDFSTANLDRCKFSQKFENSRSEGERETFPIPSLRNAYFDIIYIDEIAYSREKFFEMFDT